MKNILFAVFVATTFAVGYGAGTLNGYGAGLLNADERKVSCFDLVEEATNIAIGSPSELPIDPASGATAIGWKANAKFEGEIAIGSGSSSLHVLKNGEVRIGEHPEWRLLATDAEFAAALKTFVRAAMLGEWECARLAP